MFDSLPKYSPDPILGLIESFRSDPRAFKIDLGVGVYKDQRGVTPVLQSVKAAEKLLLGAETTKTYLGSSGNADYTRLAKRLFLGDELCDSAGDRIAAFQSLGGTGALRLAAELLKAAKPDARIWIGVPGWPNHLAVFGGAGIAVETHIYCAPKAQQIDFPSVLNAVSRAAPGDAFLIQACCHNPTGIDFDRHQIDTLMTRMHEGKIVPVVDCAYAGFGSGFEEDATVARRVLSEFDEALVCFSCSKNFGLYRERIGLIAVKTQSPETVKNVILGLSAITRCDYSQPPNHGAAVVATVLGNPELKAQWLGELDQMRAAIHRKRQRLSELRVNSPVLTAVASQHGFFSLLPIDGEVCTRLREEFGIYMTSDARINILGVLDDQEEYLADCLSRAL